MVSKLIRNFQKHPDVAQASKVGEPTLVDPKVVSATAVVQEATRAMIGGTSTPDKNSVSIETIGKGAPPPDQAAPRSDTPAPESAVVPAENAPLPADSNEPKPNEPADPNELKPNVSDNNGQAVPPPQQINEIQRGADGQGNGEAANGGKAADAASSSTVDKDDDATVSSSKHKKKKGLRKVVPF